MGTRTKTTANGVVKVLSPQFYCCNDIMKLMGISRSGAYKVISALRSEYVDRGFSINCCPTGKIPVWFYNERGGFDQKKRRE